MSRTYHESIYLKLQNKQSYCKMDTLNSGSFYGATKKGYKEILVDKNGLYHNRGVGYKMTQTGQNCIANICAFQRMKNLP